MNDKDFYTEEGSKTVGKALNENKKQVLLIGDSIRVGYCEYTKKLLEDVADVYYPPENCRNTQYIITSLRLWLNLCEPEKVDLIQFNAGHWDVAHWSGIGDSLTSVEDYCKNVIKIVKLLNLLYPNAKIVFATTTPMNPAGTCPVNPRSTEEIIEYNEKAVKVCKENGVLVNDLFEVTKTWGADMFKDYCHFVDKGYEILGTCVANTLKDLL
ncbi:MAG: hypothetical protein IKL82_01890 [Clostridia bacterium]|nr:hypothetical protein [Clostridia bacterium]